MGIGPPLKDSVGKPLAANIRRAAAKNEYARLTLWTGGTLEMALISIRPGESTGLEMHPDFDEFISIEKGGGLVKIGEGRNGLPLRRMVSEGYGIFTPAGTWRELINIGPGPLRFYAIYPPSGARENRSGRREER